MSSDNRQEEIFSKDKTFETNLTDYWKILIVDDENDYYEIIKGAIKRFVFFNKRLKLFQAKTLIEAENIYKDNQDISIVLLDIRLKKELGFNFVKFLRDEKKNIKIQIILITAFDAEFPATKILATYEISNYYLKVELTQDKLYVIIFSSLRNFITINNIEKSLRNVILQRTKLEDKFKIKFISNQQDKIRIEEKDKTITILKEILNSRKEESANSNNLLLFTHGLGGSKKRWQEMLNVIKDDRNFYLKFNDDTYEYRAPIFIMKFWTPSSKIQDISIGLKTHIDEKCSSYSNIILVCHSMGGLVARKYILEEYKAGRKINISKLLLYATPNNGAELAKLGKFISWRNNPIKQMCKDSDFIESLNEDWYKFKINDKLLVKYVLAGQDNIVSKENAIPIWGETNIARDDDKNHFSIGKPKNKYDLSYVILKNFALS
ncbi:MAG: response regulator [Bacteroidales bacterium]|nr:response regulator [Bacteroidales bacterium]